MDGFIKFVGGLKTEGEAKDARHKGEVRVLSFSVGVDAPPVMGMGQDQTGIRGKARAQPFTFAKYTDNATPQLVKACAAGIPYDEVVFALQRTTTDSTDYLVYTFTHVMITNVSLSGQTGGDAGRPVEQVSFEYAHHKVKYTPEKDFKGGSGNETEWDWAQHV